ncbi:putative toxin-antitoxin system, antitoxin component [Candidatus Vecturithrix granuli]|uniref:Putative toxin-antitoxin system, antitoxin component n=1 Tax=Vecturithrix granuli TaxID=1499967 RepID=A0A081BZ31_VECG1|nr:putative toxin-antitoxin system, antitoxin component [Candidatus Vecturithrix granuli]
MKPEIRALVTYRLEQADEALEAAHILIEHGQYRSAVNRAYYAMFYSVLSLLVVSDSQTSKHSGAISLFDRDFVKTGTFDKAFSRWLHEAFELRQESDYQELVGVSGAQAQDVLEHARLFVAA